MAEVTKMLINILDSEPYTIEADWYEVSDGLDLPGFIKFYKSDDSDKGDFLVFAIKLSFVVSILVFKEEVNDG